LFFSCPGVSSSVASKREETRKGISSFIDPIIIHTSLTHTYKRTTIERELKGGMRLLILSLFSALATYSVESRNLDTQSIRRKAPSAPVDWPPQSNPADKSMMERSQFVPFGKKIPRLPGMKYFVSSGVQECMMCRRIIKHADNYGHGFFDLCNTEVKAAQPMCQAQHKVLGSCPEFQQDWCYADNGGGDQQLLSPCPSVLKCHYCLGLNPLHCVKRGEYGTYEGM
jgi:hypothetical protein